MKRVVRTSGWGPLDSVGFSSLELKSVVGVVGVGAVFCRHLIRYPCWCRCRHRHSHLSGSPVIARPSSICPHSTPSQPR